MKNRSYPAQNLKIRSENVMSNRRRFSLKREESEKKEREMRACYLFVVCFRYCVLLVADIVDGQTCTVADRNRLMLTPIIA